jgi:hypothetical protein
MSASINGDDNAIVPSDGSVYSGSGSVVNSEETHENGGEDADDEEADHHEAETLRSDSKDIGKAIKGDSDVHIDGSESESQSESELESEAESEADSEADSDSDSDSDTDENEEPPILKYSRLVQLPKTFFQKELISSSLITDKIFVFGTSSGLLYITDLNYKSLGTLRIRKSPILSIGFDGANHIIASSIDGTIIIVPLDQLHSPSSIIAYDLKTPIYSVVLNGIYKETRSFIYGTKNGEVIMTSLNWLGSKVEKVLYRSEEELPIVKLMKIGNVLIFFNDLGIFFINLNSPDKILLNLIKPEGNKYPSELVWPKLNLQDTDRLIIGWVNKIWSIKFDGIYPVKEESKYLSSAMSTFSKPVAGSNITDNNNATINVEYEYDLKDSLIAGIGSFKDDLLIVLTIKDVGHLKEPPELRIINCYKDEEISTDEVILKNYQHLKVNDLQLGQFVHESNYKFFLICSYDCIIAEEFTAFDMFTFLVERGNYLRAWEISKNLVSLKERGEIGIKQVERYLNENDNWFQCGKFLQQVLDVEFSNEDEHEFLKEKLNQWSWIFLKSNKFKELSDILPINEHLESSKKVYNEILEHFIDANQEEDFSQCLKRWTIDRYDASLIISRLENYLEVHNDEEEDADTSIFRRCLADLYLLKNEPNSSIPHYIKLKDPIVLKLISKYHLINQNIDKLPNIIENLVQLKKDEDIMDIPIKELEVRLLDLITIIIDNRHEISVNEIIETFEANGLMIVSFFILKRLSKLNYLNDSETELVSLYAKFSRYELLNFLKKHTNYDIEKALVITKREKLHKELVYLLGKIGNVTEAMNIIIDELNDANYAIEFANDYSKTHPEIWDLFLKKGLKNPNFIKVIIEYTGIYFNANILEKIPAGMEIEDLKKSLIRITKDNELNLVIQRHILEILEKEGVVKSDELNELRVKGIAVKDFKLFSEGIEKVIVSKDGKLRPFAGL